MIINKRIDYNTAPVFLCLDEYINSLTINLKIESFNLANSIKLYPAKYMIEGAEAQGKLNKGMTIIESTSGNMGVALAHICAVKGYRFIAVTDINANKQYIKTMEAFGAEVVVISEPDKNLGYLENRLNYISNTISKNKDIIWLNQYNNDQCIKAHYDITAKQIHTEFPYIDYLFVGAGTCGTLIGCIKYFKEFSPNTKIIAVDSIGSITFSNKCGKRHFPGIGASKKPQFINKYEVKHHVMVNEKEAAQQCKRLALEYGYLSGASTGSVLAGISKFKKNIQENSSIVAISPDSGSGYIDTIYDDEWLRKNLL